MDAAILDVNLHGEMAYPVADALMARNIPLVFMTGCDTAPCSADVEHAFTVCLPRLPARLDAAARMHEFSAVVLTRSKP